MKDDKVLIQMKTHYYWERHLACLAKNDEENARKWLNKFRDLSERQKRK